MKKLIGTMLACVMILSLAGCGKSRSDRSLTAETDTVLTTAVENDVTGTEPAQTETTGVEISTRLFTKENNVVAAVPIEILATSPMVSFSKSVNPSPESPPPEGSPPPASKVAALLNRALISS